MSVSQSLTLSPCSALTAPEPTDVRVPQRDRLRGGRTPLKLRPHSLSGALRRHEGFNLALLIAPILTFCSSLLLSRCRTRLSPPLLISMDLTFGDHASGYSSFWPENVCCSESPVAVWLFVRSPPVVTVLLRSR